MTMRSEIIGIDSFDGCRLHCEMTGEGPAIVFAHESAADARQWRRQVEALSQDYRCIVYNARGYLPSEVPGEDLAYGYEAAWRDLETVAERVGGGAAHIVGLSMGAYAGLVLALKRPDLVRSLVFAGGGSGSTRKPADTMRARMDTLSRVFLDRGTEAAAATIAAPGNRTGFRSRDPEGWQEWYDDLLDHSAEGMARTYRNYQGLRPSIYDFEDELRRIERPVLLVVGDEDSGCTEVNLYLKETLKDAGLWMVPNCGHAINLEYPDAFNREIGNFLARVERGQQ